MKYCANCGGPVEDTTAICTRCGARTGIVPQTAIAPRPVISKYCTHCGNQVDDAAGVCVQCGCRVSEPTRAVSHVGSLNTNRSLLKYILLSLITFGIYGLVVLSSVSSDINMIAGRYDGKKTMHYCLVFFIFSWLTLGIVPLVWYHRLSNRIGSEMVRRGIDYSMNAGTFWLWGILGSLILIGPFVYMHKLLKAMNLLSENYNIYG